jgi:FAD/FMN-containing dehydrogenase
MTLDDTALTALRGTFAGEVLRPTDDGFPQARAEAIWNGNITRQPAAIVRPTSNEDVAAAIAFARSEGLPITVRGGGHGVAGKAVAEGGLLIDLSRLAGVRVDPEARRAYVGGGAAWAAVDAATTEHGLAVTGGTVSHTGVAGLTLGGGVGWLMSRCGLSCDNLLEATLVTADGRIVAVSEQTQPDLLWALRGAGTNFGVVTELVLALHETNPMANLGMFFWRAEEAAAPLAAGRDLIYGLDPQMGALMAGISAPPEPFVPPELQGVPGFAVVIVSWGEAGEHAAAVTPLRELHPGFELVTPIPYVALQQMLDGTAPWGIHAYDKSLLLEDLPAAAIEVLVEGLSRKRSPLSLAPLFPLRGRVREVADDATAYGPPRSRRWAVSAEGVAPDEQGLDGERQWSRDLWAALRPFAPDDGAYANLDADADAARLRATFGEPKYRRLAALKAHWDPDDVFRSNDGIVPEPTPAGVPSPRGTAEAAEGATTEPTG